MKTLIILIVMLTAIGCLTTRQDSLNNYRNQIQDAYFAGDISRSEFLDRMGQAELMDQQRQAQAEAQQAAYSQALTLWGFQKATESPLNPPTNLYLYGR